VDIDADVSDLGDGSVAQQLKDLDAYNHIQNNVRMPISNLWFNLKML
jgi:hypothetical protein